MPITTIDPRTALIVIDLQQGIAEMPLAHPFSTVTERTVDLLRAFRERGLPVVLVNVAGSPGGRTDGGSSAPRVLPDDWSVLVPELAQQPEDILVTKYARSAFTATGLAERLRALDVTQVVITGVATAGGVESTARDAHEQGFNVTLPVDAMSDSQLARHEHSVTHVFPRIAESGTSKDVLDKLAALS